METYNRIDNSDWSISDNLEKVIHENCPMLKNGVVWKIDSFLEEGFVCICGNKAPVNVISVIKGSVICSKDVW